MPSRLIFIVLCLITSITEAHNICPSPEIIQQNTKLPQPWSLNPLSERPFPLYGDLKFLRANIMVVGIGRGVICNYQNYAKIFSIWWLGSVKIPAPTDYLWRENLAGFECSESVKACVFYSAMEQS